MVVSMCLPLSYHFTKCGVFFVQLITSWLMTALNLQTKSILPATQPQNTFDGYNAMTVTLGKATYALPQLITTLSSIGMSDENIEKFLNSNGIR